MPEKMCGGKARAPVVHMFAELVTSVVKISGTAHIVGEPELRAPLAAAGGPADALEPRCAGLGRCVCPLTAGLYANMLSHIDITSVPGS